MPSTTVLASHRYELFAATYAATGSSRKAADAIDISPNAAYGILKRPEVQQRINELTTQRMKRIELTPERVMEGLMRIAFFDPRELYDRNGNLKPVHELDDDIALAIGQIKVETRMVGRGDEAVPWLTKEIKPADRMAALGLLAKHFKLVGDDADGIDALANALSARLNAARRRAQSRPLDIVDAEVVGGRTDYGMEGDTSNPDVITPPRLELPDADPESINNRSVNASDAVYSREQPRQSAATEADDEDLSR